MSLNLNNPELNKNLAWSLCTIIVLTHTVQPVIDCTFTLLSGGVSRDSNPGLPHCNLEHSSYAMPHSTAAICSIFWANQHLIKSTHILSVAKCRRQPVDQKSELRYTLLYLSYAQPVWTTPHPQLNRPQCTWGELRCTLCGAAPYRVWSTHTAPILSYALRFKSTQAWDILGLRFRILYFFVVTYA
jgi:hypothetical protein